MESRGGDRKSSVRLTSAYGGQSVTNAQTHGTQTTSSFGVCWLAEFVGEVRRCYTVNFELRSSINEGLTERSLYNRFCIERIAKMVLLGFLGEGLRYLVGTPYECNDRRSTSFGEKLWRCCKYPSLYARQINYKKNIKKTECLRREGYISPMCSAYP